MNPNKVDMTLERGPKQGSDLLHAVKVNDNNVLTKEEQNYYVSEIEYKLGIRCKNIELPKDIHDSMPDYSDIV